VECRVRSSGLPQLLFPMAPLAPRILRAQSESAYGPAHIMSIAIVVSGRAGQCGDVPTLG